MNELANKEVTLNLTAAKVSVVLSHLAQGRFSEVADLLFEIRDQVSAQLQAQPNESFDAVKSAATPM